MSIQITIRNVPEEVRDRLAARAALAGHSMQEFLRRELTRIAERPSVEQWLGDVRLRKETAPTRVTSREILRLRDTDRR